MEPSPKSPAVSEPERSCCTLCNTPTSDLAEFGEDKVCTECKPAYVQRLKEGVDGVDEIERDDLPPAIRMACPDCGQRQPKRLPRFRKVYPCDCGALLVSQGVSYGWLLLYALILVGFSGNMYGLFPQGMGVPGWVLGFGLCFLVYVGIWPHFVLYKAVGHLNVHEENG